MSINQMFISQIQVKVYGIVVNVDQFSERPSTTKMWHENRSVTISNLANEVGISFIS
jgi:hypothetical protein